jgi:dienelactone hydrolase
VAETFQRHWFGTLSLDLLTDDESADEHCRADCALLARRIGDVLQWTAAQPRLAGYRCALFGAGTGGAALLQAAAAAPGRVDAVIARGARLDLAWPSLPAVRAPTLLIAGTEAAHELEQHRAALRQLQCAKRLEVVPGATLVFQDAGVLDTVAELSAWWLTAHLGGGASR